MTLQAHAHHDAEIAALGPWFHNLHLPGGRETAPNHPLGDFPAFKWAELGPALPGELAGWSALDIGCNAGFYSFELARRGANVHAIDMDEHYLRQGRWAARELGLENAVRFERLTVYDLARRAERYDLVLFMGVLYHLRYPMLGLDIVAGHARRLLVLQTLTMPGDDAAHPASDLPPADLPFERRERLREPGWPKLAFIEHALAGDATNWWAPSAACVEAMLRSAGMEVLERPGHEVWLCRPQAARRHPWELEAALGRAPGDV